MIDFSKLEENRRYFSSKEIPLLRELTQKMRREKPYQGLRIIHNSHLTLAAIVKLEPLLLSGAAVTVTVSEELRCDPVALQLLKEANVNFVPFNSIGGNYDVALDCCGDLLNRVNVKYGAVELTQTGVVKYNKATVKYPVISVDDTETKKIETMFGTGDGFVVVFIRQRRQD